VSSSRAMRAGARGRYGSRRARLERRIDLLRSATGGGGGLRCTVPDACTISALPGADTQRTQVLGDRIREPEAAKCHNMRRIPHDVPCRSRERCVASAGRPVPSVCAYIVCVLGAGPSSAARLPPNRSCLHARTLCVRNCFTHGDSGPVPRVPGCDVGVLGDGQGGGHSARSFSEARVERGQWCLDTAGIARSVYVTPSALLSRPPKCTDTTRQQPRHWCLRAYARSADN